MSAVFPTMTNKAPASLVDEIRAAAPLIEAVRAAAPAGAPPGEGERTGRLECRWQRDRLPDAIRDLVLDDQRLRNDICWSVFDC